MGCGGSSANSVALPHAHAGASPPLPPSVAALVSAVSDQITEFHKAASTPIPEPSNLAFQAEQIAAAWLTDAVAVKEEFTADEVCAAVSDVLLRLVVRSEADGKPFVEAVLKSLAAKKVHIPHVRKEAEASGVDWSVRATSNSSPAVADAHPEHAGAGSSSAAAKEGHEEAKHEEAAPKAEAHAAAAHDTAEVKAEAA